MPLFEWSFLIAGLVLQSMVLSVMLKGPWRRYPLIFSYLIFSFLSTVVEFSLRHYFGALSRRFADFYWGVDFIATVMVLLIIIRLICAAMDKHPYRTPVYWGLLMGVAATAGISIFLMPSRDWRLLYRYNKLMTEVGRDYYFSAVILCAVLWCVLVRNHHASAQLYLLTSGLGLKLTGAAIAHALRMVSHQWLLANCFLVATYLLSLYIWYIAFERLPAAARMIGAEEPEEIPDEVETSSLRR
jgi:hypothetical protein